MKDGTNETHCDSSLVTINTVFSFHVKEEIDDETCYEVQQNFNAQIHPHEEDEFLDQDVGPVGPEHNLQPILLSGAVPASDDVPSEILKFQCANCLKCFRRKEDLRVHWREHMSSMPCECSICHSAFIGSKALHDHVKANHTDNDASNKFKCGICQMSFKKESHLIRHLNVHDYGEAVQCSMCSKEFSSLKSLNSHTNMHHLGSEVQECENAEITEPLHKCRICNKTYRTIASLNRHFAQHVGEKPFKCPGCPKQFAYKRDMMRHANTHTDFCRFPQFNHACPLCPKTFIDRIDLLRHVNVHSGLKPFSCSECNKRFSDKRGLGRHMRSHTLHKCLKCEVCDRIFTRRYLYTEHMAAHMGDEEMKCSLCGKIFSSKYAVKQHRKNVCKDINLVSE